MTVKPKDLTDAMVRDLRDSLCDGTPLTRDHKMFTACTNTLAAFLESSWNPRVWEEVYLIATRARIAAAVNARKEKP